MLVRRSRLLLSICIPTYNRAKFLNECLNSIVVQFAKNDVRNNIEIIVSDNNSIDTTQNVVRKFQSKYKNIRYFKNLSNIGNKNTIKVGTYAKGDYIWFFSDDDLHKKNSISEVIRILKKNDPDYIICNIDLISKDGKKYIDPNLLRVQSDSFSKSKKNFFCYLEDKFFLPIDWYMTCYSNKIIKKNLFHSNMSILNTYQGKQYVFPHIYFVFYSPVDYKIQILAKSIICYRAGNLSFGSSDKKEFLTDWYKTLKIHYNLVSKINKKYIGFKYSFLMFAKLYVRELRLLFLNIFGYDISDILMKLFYK